MLQQYPPTQLQWLRHDCILMQPALELAGQVEASASRSFEAGTQLLAAPSAGTRPAAATAAATARTPTLFSSSPSDGDPLRKLPGWCS